MKRTQRKYDCCEINADACNHVSTNYADISFRSVVIEQDNGVSLCVAFNTDRRLTVVLLLQNPVLKRASELNETDV